MPFPEKPRASICYSSFIISLSSFGWLSVAADDVGENPDGIDKPFGASGEAESKVLGSAEAVAGHEHDTSRRGRLAQRS